MYVIPHNSRVVKRQLNPTASAASSAGGESGRGEGQPAILGAGIFGIVAETLRYPQPTNASVSRLMRANRKTDTRPELLLRSELHRRGLRFRKHVATPAGGRRVIVDIVFPRQRLAVFVDGCFWHVCPDHGTSPSSNGWYWMPKLRRNVERDRVVDALLTADGWRVLRVWEHAWPRDAANVISATLAEISGGSRVAGRSHHRDTEAGTTAAEDSGLGEPGR